MASNAEHVSLENCPICSRAMQPEVDALQGFRFLACYHGDPVGMGAVSMSRLYPPDESE